MRNGLGEPVPETEVATLPPLPHNLRILNVVWFCGDLIAVSTEDGLSPGFMFILRDGYGDWARLTVH